MHCVMDDTGHSLSIPTYKIIEVGHPIETGHASVY